jgi:PKD repeat protein
MKNRFLHILIVLLLIDYTGYSQTIVVLNAGPELKDAYVNSITPNTNYKDYPNYFALSVFYQSDTLITRSLFEFDLSFIPSNAYIHNASLDLFFAINQYNPNIEQMGSNASLLCRIIEDWSEDELTWNNQPAYTDENQVVLPASSNPTQDYPGIDVTPLVKDMILNPEQSFGFLLKLMFESPQSAMCFASGDYEDENLRPVLTITYDSCVPPVGNFTYQADGHLVHFYGICETGLNWNWDFGDGNGSTQQNPIHNYENHGYYNVCLTVEDTCHYSVICDSILICNEVESSFEWISNGLLVNFHDTSANAVNWHWDFGDGGFSILQNPSHYFAQLGDYQVCLIASNECSADSSCQTVILNQSEIKDHGIYSIISISPNPTKEFIEVSTSQSLSGNLMLLSSNGACIMKQYISLLSGQKVKINLSEVPNGIYLFTINDGNITINEKLVICK